MLRVLGRNTLALMCICTFTGASGLAFAATKDCDLELLGGDCPPAIRHDLEIKAAEKPLLVPDSGSVPEPVKQPPAMAVKSDSFVGREKPPRNTTKAMTKIESTQLIQAPQNVSVSQEAPLVVQGVRQQAVTATDFVTKKPENQPSVTQKVSIVHGPYQTAYAFKAIETQAEAYCYNFADLRVSQSGFLACIGNEVNKRVAQSGDADLIAYFRQLVYGK